MKALSIFAALAAALLLTPQVKAGAYVDAILADNPSAYYRFEDASTADLATAANSAPGGPAATHHAIPSPIATTTGAIDLEPSNSALDLVNAQGAGETQHASVADPAVAASGNYTIEWWAKVEQEHGPANAPNGGVMVSWYSATAGGFEVGYNGQIDTPYLSIWVVPIGSASQENVFIYGDPDPTADPPNESDDFAPHAPDNRDEWFHYALVLGASNNDAQDDFLNFYVNGQPNLSLANFSHNGMDPTSYVEGLYMGQAYSNRQFLGQIDEVAVYQAALTAEQIAAHYSAARPGVAGDFDNDLDVDGDDLAKWQMDFGGPGSDSDGDGDSDGADFLIWQRNLSPPESTAVAAAVPEPATAVLACASAAGLALVGWRKSVSP